MYTSTMVFCSVLDSSYLKNDSRSVSDDPSEQSITPNNDHVNDSWGFYENMQLDEIEFIVYNRWGIPVFKKQ